MRAVKFLLALALVPSLAACAGDPITTRDPNPAPPRGYRVSCETYPFLDPIPYGELTATFDATCTPNVRRHHRHYQRTVIQTKG